MTAESSIVAPPFDTVVIVGLGLIGGSVALAAKYRWPSITVVGIERTEMLRDARSIGVADRVCDDPRELSDADLVVLAAPVRQNIALLPRLADHVRPGAIVTDAGSTKREIVGAAAAYRERFTFIGGHPLGGAASRGLGHATRDLFRGRAWLLTPESSVPPDAMHKLERFVAALGSSPAVLSADDHDRLLAFISHLPQIAASALMSVVGDATGGEGLTFAGRGLLDTTRLASSPPDIWRDIAATNADQIGPALDSLIAVLQQLRADLSDGRRLDEVFTSAAAWRDRLVSGATI